MTSVIPANRPDAQIPEIWRSMRILKEFSIPQLMTATPGIKEGVFLSAVSRLRIHGYIIRTKDKTVYRRGGSAIYRVVDYTPDHIHCPRCGKATHSATCVPTAWEEWVAGFMGGNKP